MNQQKTTNKTKENVLVGSATSDSDLANLPEGTRKAIIKIESIFSKKDVDKISKDLKLEDFTIRKFTWWILDNITEGYKISKSAKINRKDFLEAYLHILSNADDRDMRRLIYCFNNHGEINKLNHEDILKSRERNKKSELTDYDDCAIRQFVSRMAYSNVLAIFSAETNARKIGGLEVAGLIDSLPSKIDVSEMIKTWDKNKVDHIYEYVIDGKNLNGIENFKKDNYNCCLVTIPTIDEKSVFAIVFTMVKNNMIKENIVSTPGTENFNFQVYNREEFSTDEFLSFHKYSDALGCVIGCIYIKDVKKVLPEGKDANVFLMEVNNGNCLKPLQK